MGVSSYIESLTLGMVRYLEKLPCIKKVIVIEKPHNQESVIASWEQKNNCILPPDLRIFYATTDGVQVKWNWKMKDEIVLGGNTEIVRLRELKFLIPRKHVPNCELPSLVDVESDVEETITHTSSKPLFKDKSKILVIDKCHGLGKVCLVYPPKKDGSGDASSSIPSVWFLDRANEFHYLTVDFTHYFRMAFVHLGISQWQYLFTPAGAPPKTKQMLHIFAPERLHMSTNISSIK